MRDARRLGVIAVTGASRGIGAGIALELRAPRLHRGLPHAQGQRARTRRTCRARPRSASSRCRLRRHREASVQRRARRARRRAAARLNGLVNNAGIHLRCARATSCRRRPTRRSWPTTRLRFSLRCREAYPASRRSAGGGIIVNIGSFFDKMGVKRNLAYCASKAAVGAMTRCLAVEWAAKGIRVVDVAPGLYRDRPEPRRADRRDRCATILAKRIPGGRHGTAAEVARLVAAIFSEDIPFLTGETIYLDGGQGMRALHDHERIRPARREPCRLLATRSAC